jgi:hypothetical protein
MQAYENPFPKRPDAGGHAGRPINLKVNFFKVKKDIRSTLALL